MLRASGWILTAGLLLCGGAQARGQMEFPGDTQSGWPMQGGPMGMPTSPELEGLQQEQTELMKAADPELADYQEKMRSVQDELGKVMKSLAAEEIDKDKARAELLPLIKERQELRDDPAFQAEQILSQAAFSTPEFQKKMAKIQEKINRVLQRLMAKRMRQARGGRPVVARAVTNAPPQSGPER